MQFRDTVVSILIDSSGSMRRRCITIAAMRGDIWVKHLSLAQCVWRFWDLRRVRGEEVNPAKRGSIRASQVIQVDSTICVISFTRRQMTLGDVRDAILD